MEGNHRTINATVASPSCPEVKAIPGIKYMIFYLVRSPVGTVFKKS